MAAGDDIGKGDAAQDQKSGTPENVGGRTGRE